MPNIEIKAIHPDLESAREITEKIGATYVGKDHQVDTYFKTAYGRLKLRESSLSGVQLIPYVRPDQAGPKKSDYALLPIENGPHVKSLLAQILGVDQVVEKYRDIYLFENVRIHLDEVSGLGSFFEFEAVYEVDTQEMRDREQSKLEELLSVFNIQKSQLLRGSYREMEPATNSRQI